MRKISLAAFMLCLLVISFAQSKDAEAVKTVLKQYNNAIEKLDVTGTEKLFTADSKIYESGGSEFAKQICNLCAEICNAGAVECEKHSQMEHCKKWAEVCRKFSVECSNMSKI